VTLLVARHASVAISGVCYGQSDVPTTLRDDDAGEALLEQLAALAIPIARVYGSPWRRARGPAAHVAGKLGLPLTVDARLSELSFGAWEGRPYAELETEAAFQRWMAGWQSAQPPGGERLDDLLQRVRAFRREVLSSGEASLADRHGAYRKSRRSNSAGGRGGSADRGRR